MARRFFPLIILAIGIGGFVLMKLSRPEPEAVAAQERAWLVDVMTVRPAEHAPVLPLYGELLAPDQVQVTSPVAGRIAERPVQEGQLVAEGELLVALDNADLQPSIDRAEADVLDLEAQIQAEEIRFANDKKVLTGEKSILANAQRQYERTEPLVGRNLASQEDLEAAADALARARLTVTLREQTIAEHPSRLKSLQARLARAKAALAATRLDAKRAKVAAPFRGVVTDIRAAPGDQVSANSALLSVYPLQGLELRARVPDRYRQELFSALESGYHPEAVTEDGRHRFTLARFAGTSDPAGTEAILTLATLEGEGEDHGLRPGGFLSVLLQRPAVSNVVAIPYAALYGSDSVYLLTDDSRMRRIRVDRLGEAPARGPDAQGERRVLVASSQLEAGRQLITTHLPNAMTDLKVEVAPAGDESMKAVVNETTQGSAE